MRSIAENYVEESFFGFVPAQTQCGNCNKVTLLEKAVVTTHHITTSVTETEHFCSESCALDAWRKRVGYEHSL